MLSIQGKKINAFPLFVYLLNLELYSIQTTQHLGSTIMWQSLTCMQWRQVLAMRDAVPVSNSPAVEGEPEA